MAAEAQGHSQRSCRAQGEGQRLSRAGDSEPRCSDPDGGADRHVLDLSGPVQALGLWGRVQGTDCRRPPPTRKSRRSCEPLEVEETEPLLGAICSAAPNQEMWAR